MTRVTTRSDFCRRALPTIKLRLRLRADEAEQPDDRIPSSIPSEQESTASELSCRIEELTRQQNEARARAAYGGMTETEEKEYDERRERISRLTEKLLRAERI